MVRRRAVPDVAPAAQPDAEQSPHVPNLCKLGLGEPPRVGAADLPGLSADAGSGSATFR